MFCIIQRKKWRTGFGFWPVRGEIIQIDDRGGYTYKGITNPHYLGVLTLHCQM